MKSTRTKPDQPLDRRWTQRRAPLTFWSRCRIMFDGYKTAAFIMIWMCSHDTYRYVDMLCLNFTGMWPGSFADASSWKPTIPSWFVIKECSFNILEAFVSVVGLLDDIFIAWEWAIKDGPPEPVVGLQFMLTVVYHFISSYSISWHVQGQNASIMLSRVSLGKFWMGGRLGEHGQLLTLFHLATSNFHVGMSHDSQFWSENNDHDHWLPVLLFDRTVSEISTNDAPRYGWWHQWHYPHLSSTPRWWIGTGLSGIQ